jgi:hypothetical protein
MAAIAIGITSLCVGVANLVTGQVQRAQGNDNDKRTAFTQQFVQQASGQYPDYNVVICHPQHQANGPQVIHQHYELGMTVGTCGYDVYFSKKGQAFTFNNQGDGGFINWAFEGEFDRNGNQLTAKQHA